MLYHNFITDFETKINLLKLAHFAVIVSRQYSEKEAAINYLEEVIEKLQATKEQLPSPIWRRMVLVYLSKFLINQALEVLQMALTSLPLRVAPYVRVIIFILNIRELRAFILILARMIRIYLNVLALWLLFLLFASWVAYVTFEDTQEGKLVFTSYGTTLHQMFVLFTISNNLDVWILAYKASRWYYFFFYLNFAYFILIFMLISILIFD